MPARVIVVVPPPPRWYPSADTLPSGPGRRPVNRDGSLGGLGRVPAKEGDSHGPPGPWESRAGHPYTDDPRMGTPVQAGLRSGLKPGSLNGQLEPPPIYVPLKKVPKRTQGHGAQSTLGIPGNLGSPELSGTVDLL